MNWNDNNSPWGSGNGGNPWGKGPSNADFDDTLKKAKKSFKKFNLGNRKNISIFLLVAFLLWLASGFYRVEPDEQGIELLFGKWNQSTTEPGLHYFFPTPIGKTITPKVEAIRKINIGFRTTSDMLGSRSNAARSRQ